MRAARSPYLVASDRSVRMDAQRSPTSTSSVAASGLQNGGGGLDGVRLVPAQCLQRMHFQDVFGIASPMLGQCIFTPERLEVSHASLAKQKRFKNWLRIILLTITGILACIGLLVGGEVFHFFFLCFTFVFARSPSLLN